VGEAVILSAVRTPIGSVGGAPAPASAVGLGRNPAPQAGLKAAPHVLPGSRTGVRMGDATLVDTMIRDGLWCAMTDCHMGVTAQNVAAGRFDEEIVPVEVPQRRGEPVSVTADELPRPDTTSRERVEQIGARPLATIRGWASAGVAPRVMGVGPVGAVRRALERAGITVDDLDPVELNEAFAAQSLAVVRGLGLDPALVNVNGGAIALGHPIGASGARVLTTLLHEMARRDARLGLASLCIGGGQGIAMVAEREPD
jgi:acetyl-CoA C-acetyltransferase